MPRPLSAEERALWRRVVESVRPLHVALPNLAAEETVEVRPVPRPAARPVRVEPPKKAVPGTTLDASWDRRLARGLVGPDRSLDLHGHNLARAWDLLDRRLGEAVADGARLLLLITGKPPSDRSGRGAIRAAVGGWLAASPHAGDIAAVRNAHARHGGAGALYIVLRRRRKRP